VFSLNKTAKLPPEDVPSTGPVIAAGVENITEPPETEHIVVAPDLSVMVDAAAPITIPPIAMLVPMTIAAPVVHADNSIELFILPIKSPYVITVQVVVLVVEFVKV